MIFNKSILGISTMCLTSSVLDLVETSKEMKLWVKFINSLYKISFVKQELGRKWRIMQESLKLSAKSYMLEPGCL